MFIASADDAVTSVDRMMRRQALTGRVPNEVEHEARAGATSDGGDSLLSQLSYSPTFARAMLSGLSLDELRDRIADIAPEIDVTADDKDTVV